MNGNICNFSKRTRLHSSGQNSVIYQPNLTSLVSKWRRHLPASYDMLLIGLIWNISGKIGLLEVSRNFFCWVYIVIGRVSSWFNRAGTMMLARYAFRLQDERTLRYTLYKKGFQKGPILVLYLRPLWVWKATGKILYTTCRIFNGSPKDSCIVYLGTMCIMYIFFVILTCYFMT